jgi:hypothetical protein
LLPCLATGVCDPNERLYADKDGKQFLDLRWPLGRSDRLVRLRVPMEFISHYDPGCHPEIRAANYTDPYASIFFIDMSLPDFQTRTEANSSKFVKGLNWSSMSVQIDAQRVTSDNGKTQEDIDLSMQRLFDEISELYLHTDTHNLMRGVQQSRKIGTFRA